MRAPNKSRIKSSSIFIFLTQIIFMQAAAAECNFSNLTASPDEGYALCWYNCRAQIPATLSCHALYADNIFCPEHCADATQPPSCDGAASGSSSPASIGNPIDLSNGAKTHMETDYRGPGEFPLEITRFYSSSRNMPTTNMGEKWQGLASYTISSITNNLSGDVYTVIRPDGQRLQYNWVSGGGGTTVPLKASTTATLTLYNSSIPDVPNIFSLVFKDGTEEVYEFDLNKFIADKSYQSKLLWITTPTGLQHSFSYDTEGRVSTITDVAGRTLTYTYYTDGSNRVHTIEVPGNRTYTYGYDTAGNLNKVTYPDSKFKTYHYEDTNYPNHLTGITDENNERYATYAYNSTGLAISTEHAGGAGKMEVITYGDNVRVRNAAGKESVYHFQKVGSGGSLMKLLTGVDGESTSNCVASNTTVTYENGKKDIVKDGRDYYTDYDRDSKGRVIKKTEALQMFEGSLVSTPETRISETIWNEDDLIEEVRVAGKTTNFTYENLRIKTITETDTTTTSVPYSTQGTSRTWTYNYTFHDALKTKLKMVSVDGPRSVNDVTEQHFDVNSYLTKTVQWINASQKLETVYSNHTADGLPQTMVDPNGVTTLLTYTPRGWVDTITVQTSAGNALTDYDYDSAGQVTKITLPNTVELNYEYDAAHRLTDIYTSTGERTKFELDSFGNQEVVRVTNSSNEIRSLQNKLFDDLGRLWKVIGVEAQELQVNSYDENGNLQSIANSDLKSVVQAFDGLNRLKQVTDRESGIVVFTYDAQDNLISVKDQKNLTTTYVVDGFGRRIQESSPDSGVTVFRYDLADNLEKETDARNVVTDFTYDAMNRLMTVVYPAAAYLNITYQYDETTTAGVSNAGKGRMTGATEANGNSSQWIYNQLGQVVRDIRTIGGQTYTTIYKYDLAGALTGITYPSGREVGYLLNTNGLIETLRTRKISSDSWTTLVSGAVYEPFGPMQSFNYGNGMTQTNAYDMHYRPDTLVAANGATAVHGIDLGFNLNNEITSLDNLVNPTLNQSFVYDDNQRLDLATGGYGQLDYEYDGVGNRTDRIASGAGDTFNETYAYPVDSHRLEDVSATGTGGQNKTFGYSDAGNITSDGSYTYEYNDRNRLTSVKQGSSVLASFEYNPLGQRIQKTAGGVTTHFHYDQNNLLLAESMGDGTPLKDYVYLGNQLIAMIEVEGGGAVLEADLEVKFSGGTAKKIGETTTYRVPVVLTISNIGAGAAENVMLTNTFPAPGTTLESIVTPQGSCSADGLSCNLGTIAAGASIIVAINTIEDEKTKEFYTSAVTTTSPESNLVNNTESKKMGGSLAWWFIAALAGVLGYRKFKLQQSGSAALALALLFSIGFGFSSETVLADQIYYVHSDHLSTPSVVTDQNKQVVWQGDRKPFGETTASVSTVNMPIRFPGQYEDSETGIHYNMMRDYSPELGRYLQSDPIGLAGGINTFGYSYQSPEMYTDQDGTFANIIFGGLMGAGLDIGLQLLMNGGKYNCLDWAEIGLSGAAGAAGVGLLEKFTKLFQAGRGLKTGLGTKIRRAFWEDRRTFNASKDFFNRYGVGSNHGWSMEHMLIKQRWYRGANPIFPQGSTMNRLLQGFGDAGWNVFPIPQAMNSALYHNTMASAAFNLLPYGAGAAGLAALLDGDDCGCGN